MVRRADGVSLREIVMHKVDDDGAQRDSDGVTQGERASERAKLPHPSLPVPEHTITFRFLATRH